MAATEPLLSAYSCQPPDDAFLQDDARSIVFNLHTWSYRLSAKEFAKYAGRSRLEAAARRFHAQHADLLAAASAGASPRSLFTVAGGGGGRSSATKGRAVSMLRLPIKPINHPFQAGWCLLMLGLDMVYPAILLPLLFAFDLLHPSKPAYWLDVAVGFVYAADMLVVLHRGVVVRYLDQHVYIDSGRDIFELYLTHGHFLFDLPVALSGPLQLLALLPEWWHLGGRGVTGFVSVLLLLRGLRLVKLLLLSRELFFGRMGFRHMDGPSLYRWYLLSLLYVLAVLTNWLACMMLFIAHLEGPASSWLADVKGRDLSEAPHFHQYVAACYWQLITTLTVGYGDITAATTLEQGAVIVAVVIGVVFIGFTVKSVGDVLSEVALQDEGAQRLAALRGRTAELKVWAAWQDLPDDLEDALFRFFMGPWLTKQVMARHCGNVLQDLPAQLRGQVQHHLLLEKATPLSPLLTRLLAGTPLQVAWHLLALLEPLPLAPGQQLCWQGDPAEHLWLLQEGTITTLDGVVPCSSGVVSAPALVVAFDGARWLRPLQQHVVATQPGQPQARQAAVPAGPGLGCDWQPQAGGGDAGAAGSCTCNVSYQTVSTTFLWRLPLRQVALAVRARPHLLRNLQAELEAAGLRGGPGSARQAGGMRYS